MPKTDRYFVLLSEQVKCLAILLSGNMLQNTLLTFVFELNELLEHTVFTVHKHSAFSVSCDVTSIIGSLQTGQSVHSVLAVVDELEVAVGVAAVAVGVAWLELPVVVVGVAAADKKFSLVL